MDLAHAFGERYELPIPLLLFLVGGAVVVLVSFAFVAPRAVPAGTDASDALLPDRPHRQPRLPGWGALSVLVLGLLCACGLLGSQTVSENLLPTAFWLVTWIAVPLSCGLLGDWTQAVNPFAALARLADSDRARQALLGGPAPVGWPDRLGWWPAVVLFFLGAWGELIVNATATLPAVTATALLVYAVVSAVAGLVFGPRWLERGELFTVLFATWGRLGWFRFGAPGRRGFGGGLRVPFEATPSRVVFTLLLLISVNVDGLLATPRWAAFERGLPAGLGGTPQRLEGFRTGTFLVLGLLVGALFTGFAVAAARSGRHSGGPRDALAGLLPSLLPIAFGYLLAHNIQYLLVNAQLAFPLIGNPVGRESWPLHLPFPFNDSYEVHRAFLPNAFYWYAAVVVIVGVHVVAVLFAHRHLAARGRDERAARRSEYPWLVAMVGYTMLSLYLIAQPFTRDTAATPGQTGSAAVAPAVTSTRA